MPFKPDGAVRVDGLRELRRDVRRVSPELVPLLRNNLKRAGDSVVSSARRRLRSSIRNQGRSDGSTEGTLRVTSGGNVIYIKGGNAGHPHYGWLDFGGQLKPIGGRRNLQSRPKIKKGRYIYPAIAENNRQIADGVKQAVEASLRRNQL